LPIVPVEPVGRADPHKAFGVFKEAGDAVIGKSVIGGEVFEIVLRAGGESCEDGECEYEEHAQHGAGILN